MAKEYKAEEKTIPLKASHYGDEVPFFLRKELAAAYVEGIGNIEVSLNVSGELIVFLPSKKDPEKDTAYVFSLHKLISSVLDAEGWSAKDQPPDVDVERTCVMIETCRDTCEQRECGREANWVDPSDKEHFVCQQCYEQMDEEDRSGLVYSTTK